MILVIKVYIQDFLASGKMGTVRRRVRLQAQDIAWRHAAVSWHCCLLWDIPEQVSTKSAVALVEPVS